MFRFESEKPKINKFKIIFPIILVLILIIGGFFWASTKINNQSKISFTKSKNNSINNQSQIDSDNDGLFDWQEELFGTDKYNPDTDNDGTKDGDEIKQNRDPLKKGPDDEKENINLLLEQISNETQPKFNPNNLTDKFAASITNQLLEKTNNPEGLLDELPTISKNIILKDFSKISLDNLENLLFVREINNNELKIIPDSQEAKINYFENFNKIMEKNFSNFPKKELETALSDPENNQLIFKKIAGMYEYAISDFLNLKVPQSLLDLHKEKMKILIVSKNIFEKIANYNDDPLASVIALKILPNISELSQNLDQKLIEIAKNL